MRMRMVWFTSKKVNQDGTESYKEKKQDLCSDFGPEPEPDGQSFE
jgi:hypothetical protein